MTSVVGRRGGGDGDSDSSVICPSGSHFTSAAALHYTGSAEPRASRLDLNVGHGKPDCHVAMWLQNQWHGEPARLHNHSHHTIREHSLSTTATAAWHVYTHSLKRVDAAPARVDM